MLFHLELFAQEGDLFLQAADALLGQRQRGLGAVGIGLVGGRGVVLHDVEPAPPAVRLPLGQDVPRPDPPVEGG